MTGKSVAITGASGFIGGHLLRALDSAAKPISLQDSDWPQALASSKPSSIVHLAGFAYSRGSEEKIRELNVEGTKVLAAEAARHGVNRFIFISSIQALSEKTAEGDSVNTKTSAAPQGAYGRSKLEAEHLLRRLSMESRMEVVIIRPPLVYGPGVKANFRNLLQLADKGIPLPIGALKHNRRSFVGVSNLIDLILLCLEHPAAANQTFHVSDDDDISTAELLRRMGKALGKPVRNVPLPQAALKTGLRLVGKGEWVDKLFGDLRVDISETKRLLGWKPRVTMEEELERTAKWWREREGRG
jgi:nucleoside-diphosphate-sugar epimerase